MKNNRLHREYCRVNPRCFCSVAPGKIYEIRDETYYTYTRAHLRTCPLHLSSTIVQRKRKPIWDDYVAFALNPPDILRESRSQKTPLIRNDVVSCHGLVRINIKQTEENTAAGKERDGEYRTRTSGGGVATPEIESTFALLARRGREGERASAFCPPKGSYGISSPSSRKFALVINQCAETAESNPPSIILPLHALLRLIPFLPPTLCLSLARAFSSSLFFSGAQCGFPVDAVLTRQPRSVRQFTPRPFCLARSFFFLPVSLPLPLPLCIPSLVLSLSLTSFIPARHRKRHRAGINRHRVSLGIMGVHERPSE